MSMEEVAKVERATIMELGKEIGFGRVMQLAEQCWRELAAERGLSGSEHTTGPCAEMMVPCPCGAPAQCDWCCGAGRVTKRVREAMTSPSAGRRGRLTGRTLEIETGEVLAECRWDDGLVTWQDSRGWPKPLAVRYVDDGT